MHMRTFALTQWATMDTVMLPVDYSWQEKKSCRKATKVRPKPVCTHTHLGVLWWIKDVHSAGFDAVGLGPTVQSKAALPAPAVPTWKRAIVPKKRQTEEAQGRK